MLKTFHIPAKVHAAVIGLRFTAASKRGKEMNLNLPVQVSVNCLYLSTGFINLAAFKKTNF
jgi:hypothetical protein